MYLYNINFYCYCFWPSYSCLMLAKALGTSLVFYHFRYKLVKLLLNTREPSKLCFGVGITKDHFLQRCWLQNQVEFCNIFILKYWSFVCRKLLPEIDEFFVGIK